MLPFFCTCKNDKVENSTSNDVIGKIHSIAITDGSFVDRLNPESSAYFGETFIQNIRISVLVDGKKCRTDYDFIRPPYRETENYGMIDEGTGGYYVIGYPVWYDFLENNHIVSYAYIEYPDGNEDEIKVQYFKNEDGSLFLVEKMWINGELAFELGAWEVKDFYYNPKYYPWLEPLLDDFGKPTGKLIPNPNYVVVITK